MRSLFDEQLALMNRELTQMGELCARAISQASKALGEASREHAGTAAALAGEIDRMERDVESLCLKLLLRQQPVARDLRKISAALKIITDMKRIGDQAEDIGEIVLTALTGSGPLEEVAHIRDMAAAAAKMVTESVEACVAMDPELARAVIARDDVLDGYFRQIRGSILQKIAGDPARGEQALDLLMIDKYLERIGDHAVNIARWAVFSVTGSKEVDSPREAERGDAANP